MLILRIKQAECALADGRLEEAFELVQAKDLREHRRGQDLAGQLARAYVQRARKHLEAGELTLASGDCDRASRLGGNNTEVAEVRTAVLAGMQQKQEVHQLHAQVLAAAQQQIREGQLSVGQKLLSGVQDTNGQAAALRQDVAARRVMIEAIAQKASDALEHNEWETAIDELMRARQLRVIDSHLRELIAQTTRLVTQQTQQAIESGRLDRATLLLKRLGRISEQTVDSEHVRRLIEQCRQAWTAIQRGEPRQAEQIMRRLASIMPSARWVEAALKHLQQAGQAADELFSGPLGLLDDDGRGDAVTMHPQERPREAMPLAPVPAVPVPNGERLPSRFVIQADGIGSFLVLRQSRVSIGPVSSTPNPDVAVLAEAQTPAVIIERVEDDYFLKQSKAESRGKLLVSGERIAVTARCRMMFRIPSPASSTALLEMNSARLPRADIRHVVLMERELILGCGPAVHIRCDELAEQAVFHVKDGRLYCQAKNEISIDDQPADRGGAIPLGRHIRVGAVTFVVTQG